MHFTIVFYAKRLIIQIYEYHCPDCLETDASFFDICQYFCVLMIRWYPNLAQNLKMFQNCLTIPHTTAPTI